ncbi:GNAT family N-acetyltransferase [Microbacterium rhizomatis]|nr:GNAT family N-acetyltransferase [Microbacterium rhizomatis]
MTHSDASWSLLQVDWHDERAIALRAAMDDELGARYADRFDEFDAETIERFDRDFAVDPETIVATVLVVDPTGEAVGHAALRALGDELEVKRVFVRTSVRGRGASRALMGELERIGRERGARRLILQTGDRQQDAVTLYERIGYTPIPIFAPYLGFDFSLCFEKALGPA